MEENKEPLKQPKTKAPKGAIIKFITVLVVSVALAAWFTFAPLFPATVFIRWQLGWFDGYWYPKFTFAVVWIIMLLVVTFVTLSITWLWNKLKVKSEK